MIGGLGALGRVTLRPSGWSESAPAGPAGAAGQAAPASFLEALGQAGTSAAGTLRQAEAASLSALSGEADPRMVVDAVMRAEQTLQTAVAIRDKIVTAYLEISRMAI